MKIHSNKVLQTDSVTGFGVLVRNPSRAQREDLDLVISRSPVPKGRRPAPSATLCHGRPCREGSELKTEGISLGLVISGSQVSSLKLLLVCFQPDKLGGGPGRTLLLRLAAAHGSARGLQLGRHHPQVRAIISMPRSQLRHYLDSLPPKLPSCQWSGSSERTPEDRVWRPVQTNQREAEFPHATLTQMEPLRVCLV